MATKVFIDGEHGTTGLQIQTRLSNRQDIELISIPHALRHDKAARLERLTASDIAILCLPDNAAIDAVKMLENSKTRIIDSSTAHRTNVNWTYGFAEMTKGQKEKIQQARFVANPGCYPTGAISLIRPLREANIIGSDYPISINAVSGYSGGGNQMIAQMENPKLENAIHANYFTYGLNLHHKHVPEISQYGQLSTTPIFVPSVGRFPQGMIVNLPLHQSLFKKSVNRKDLTEIFQNHYKGQNIVTLADEDEYKNLARIDPEMLVNSDTMKLYIFADKNNEIFNLCAILDNLGKGASGAAVQNLDLMIGKN